MELTEHRLTKKSEEMMLGVCKICGPINLISINSYRGYSYLACPSPARNRKVREYAKNRAKHSANIAAYHARHRGEPRYIARIMRNGAKQRAAKKEIPHDITIEDILEVWEDNCPICQVGLSTAIDQQGGRDNSYSLDAIDPKKGYTKGNIAIMCCRCNRLKNNATAEEHRRIADWMDLNAS